mmetsp:Transcript_16936/g.36621  ORF Transcript_16936/g.36621 Transcript_16936/m.36621 type:complete len:372 (+) Transcript_16936:132-1247(+)
MLALLVTKINRVRCSVRSFATKSTRRNAGGDRHSNIAGLAKLIILRHGQSTWNATPTFTGWCDAPLTERGVAEARSSGELLRERGLENVDVAYTSKLRRAIVTCELAMEHAGVSPATPVERAWQLNERHYGALQGFRKDDPDILAEHGAERLASWRRDFSAAPPAMDEDHDHYAPPPAPLTESLEDCQTRVLAYWNEIILPSLTPNGAALLVAHSNTLRGLVSYLDRVPPERVPHIHIPNSVPCVYEIDPASGEAVSPLLDTPAGGSRGRWIFSSENHERLRGKIGGSGSFARSIFEAWDLNGDGELDRGEIQIGLGGLVGGEDVAVSALAGKILEEIDKDGSQTLDLDEFETFALDACRKFMPGLMEEET